MDDRKILVRLSVTRSFPQNEKAPALCGSFYYSVEK